MVKLNCTPIASASATASQLHPLQLLLLECVHFLSCTHSTKVASSGGWTTVVTRDLRTYYTLYCVCVITSGRTRGTAAEADTIRAQFGVIMYNTHEHLYVLYMHVCDHTRLVLARDTAAQSCWCIRVGGCARLTQTWWRR